MAEEAETLVIRVKLLGQRQFAAESAAVRAEIAETAAATTTANSKIAKTSFNAGLLGSGFHMLARAGKVAGLGMIAAGVGAAVAGVHFEQEMGKVASVVDLTGKQYKQLSQMALAESTKTRFSATEAAEAMYLLGRSGFKANAIMKALPGTLALAHASGIDLASAARIQTEALRGFNYEGKDAGLVADTLARATRGGNVSMQDLQYTIKYVGAASFSTGQKMSDMVGLIEAMARHGIRGTQAGTSLRTMLTRLVDPVKQTRDGLDMLGIKSKDLYGKNGLLPLPQILEKIRQQMKKLDAVSASRALHKISGQWAFSGISALMNTDPKIVAGMIDALQPKKVKGTAKEMAEILNNTVQMQLLRFWHTLEAIGIGIYMAFRVPLKNALKEVNHWLQRLVLNMPALQKLIQAGDWDGLVKKIDDLTGAQGRLFKAWLLVKDTAKEFWTFVKTVIWPIAKQWAVIIGVTLYLAFIAINKVLHIMNNHARATKTVLGVLLLMYLHWKTYTMIVATAMKIQAGWAALMLARTRALVVWTKAVRVATLLWTGAMWLLDAAMAANPVVLIILAIVALVVVLVILYKKWGWFHRAVDNFFNWLRENWRLLPLLLLGPVGAAVILIIAKWGEILDFFRAMPGRLAKVGGHMWDWLKTGFVNVMNWIINKWNSVAKLFAFSTPNIPGTNTGGIDYGGLPTISPIGAAASAAATSPATKPVNVFPPKVLDPKGPGGNDPSKNPYINPTVEVHLDGKVIATSVNKHNATRKARH